jgi:hypothetical protein
MKTSLLFLGIALAATPAHAKDAAIPVSELRASICRSQEGQITMYDTSLYPKSPSADDVSLPSFNFHGLGKFKLASEEGKPVLRVADDDTAFQTVGELVGLKADSIEKGACQFFPVRLAEGNSLKAIMSTGKLPYPCVVKGPGASTGNPFSMKVTTCKKRSFRYELTVGEADFEYSCKSKVRTAWVDSYAREEGCP